MRNARDNLLVVDAVASPIQADITPFEPIPNISKLGAQFALALACVNVSLRTQRKEGQGSHCVIS